MVTLVKGIIQDENLLGKVPIDIWTKVKPWPSSQKKENEQSDDYPSLRELMVEWAFQAEKNRLDPSFEVTALSPIEVLRKHYPFTPMDVVYERFGEIARVVDIDYDHDKFNRTGELEPLIYLQRRTTNGFWSKRLIHAKHNDIYRGYLINGKVSKSGNN